MSVKMRQEVERKIVQAAIKQLLAAGFSLDVNDGEETTLKHSTDAAAIVAAMFTTDEDYLFVNEPGAGSPAAALKGGSRIGWVRFIYGNDGYDVMSDYTVNLESQLTEANKLAESYS